MISIPATAVLAIVMFCNGNGDLRHRCVRELMTCWHREASKLESELATTQRKAQDAEAAERAASPRLHQVWEPPIYSFLQIEQDKPLDQCLSEYVKS